MSSFVLCVDVLVYGRHLDRRLDIMLAPAIAAKPTFVWDDHPSFASLPINITNSLDSNNKLYQELDHREDRLSFHLDAYLRNNLEGDIVEGIGLEDIDPGGTYIGLVDIDYSQNIGPVQAGIALGLEKDPAAGYNTPFVVLVDNMPVDLTDPGCPLDSCLTGPVGILHNPRIPRM